MDSEDAHAIRAKSLRKMTIPVEPRARKKKREEVDNEGGKTAAASKKESHADHSRFEDLSVAL